ncbi:MAG: FHA domain-containing protein, partial [Planctomycetota bacterium]
MDTAWTWILRVIETEGTTQEYEVKDGLTIGRHPDCDITIHDSHVSKRHAKIIARDGGFAVVDLGSNNGTQVGTNCVLGKDEERQLEVGLAIRVGTTQLLAFGSADPQDSTIEGRLPQPADPTELPTELPTQLPTEEPVTLPPSDVQPVDGELGI